MSYATIRDGIEAALNSVTDIGRVHDYWRYDTNVATFAEHFKTTIGGVAQIRAWIVQFGGIEPSKDGVLGTHTSLYQFIVSGYRSLNDAAASEKEFMALAETVVRSLAAKRDFGDSEVRDYSTTITGVDVDLAMFAETLCHRARINLSVEVDHVLGWS